jgi:uncharacterized protein YecE (DUF72 family)
MEFGKVTDAELKKIDFTLPPDGKYTLTTLSEARRVDSPEFYIGCAKWGRKEWRGLIYPQKTKDANFLDEYVKHFNAIELNAVFYNMPKIELVKGWKEKAVHNAAHRFLFCPKFPRVISHLKKLKNAVHETDQYISSMSEFGDFLGPCFLQLSDNFGCNNLPVLMDYLKSLPVDFKVFVELRHQDWFGDFQVSDQVFKSLRDLKIGSVISDVSGRRDVLHMNLTTPEAFIRFVGNGEAHRQLDFKRIDEWVIRLKSWFDTGLQKVYFFVHQDDEKDTPMLADYAMKEFNKHLKSNFTRLQFLPKDENLFD